MLISELKKEFLERYSSNPVTLKLTDGGKKSF